MANILVCYSTQSGTSETLTGHFVKELSNYEGVEFTVENISQFEDDFTPFMKYDLVIFFISSYGQGEPCDDGVCFFKRLEENNTIKGISYSVFGCGNSFYDDYQAVAIQLNDILQSDNNLIGELGFGDDGKNSMVDDFYNWLFDYANVFANTLNVKLNDENIQFVENFQIVESQDSSTQDSKPPFNELNPFESAVLLENTNYFDNQSYIHFEVLLNTDKSRFRYQTGDHVGIYPENKGADVKGMLEILGDYELQNGVCFKIIPKNRMQSNKFNNLKFKTLEELLRQSIEISAALTRKLIKDLLRYFIKNDSNCYAPLEAIIKDQKTFKQEITDKKVTFVKLFQKLNIIRGVDYDHIPLSFIVENLGFVKPRFYSISNSNLMKQNKDKISILMKFENDEMNSFDGVCSKHIQDIVSGNRENKVSVFLKNSKFKLPFQLNKPIILVCNGTGIAPFKGFFEDIISSSVKKTQVSAITLYFGIRNFPQSLIYDSFLSSVKDVLEQKLTIKLCVSQNIENEEKSCSYEFSNMYVQDTLLIDRKHVRSELIDEKGSIFVCGSAGGMSKGVRKILTDILGDTPKEGDQMVQYLINMGRYKEDVW